MAKQASYIIAEDDPDILYLKQRVDKELKIFKPDNNHRYLPGSETETWNSLNMLNGNLLEEYLGHITQQISQLLGRWSNTMFLELQNLIPLLVQHSQKSDYSLFLKLDLALQHSITLPKVHTTSTPDPHVLSSTVNSTEVECWMNDTVKAWVAVAQYCDSHGSFNKVVKTRSTPIKPHHFLAVVALILNDSASEHGDVERALYAALFFKLIRVAEKNQDHEKQLRDNSKRRTVLSPDDWIKQKLSDSKNTRSYRGITRDLFLKGWLYHYTQQHKTTSQTTLIYVLKSEFKELESKSDSRIKALLTRLKAPGSLTSS